MDIEAKLRKLLLPVFGLDSIEQIQPEASFVKDIGADSIDFVEIIYIVEQHFGVVLKINEIFIEGIPIDPDKMFVDGELTEENALVLRNNFPESSDKIKSGMTKMDFFKLLTVRDLANIIKAKMSKGV